MATSTCSVESFFFPYKKGYENSVWKAQQRKGVLLECNILVQVNWMDNDANYVYFQRTVGQHYTLLLKGNTKTMKPETVTTPSRSLLLTLWTFVFADDMRRKRCSLSTQLPLTQETMIIRCKLMVKRPTNQPRRNREVILSRRSLQERVGIFVKRHPAEHTQQLRTLFTQGTDSDVRSQATHPPTCTRFCLSITSRNPASTSSPSDKFGSHAS